MNTQGPVRLAIHGCGGHAINHMAFLPDANLLEVVALSDMQTKSLDLATATLMGAGRPAPAIQCHSLKELLQMPDIDAVFIATPDEFHAEEARVALRAGKHILAEKPLAVNDGQLYSIGESVDFARENDLIFLTCHPRRFDPRYVELRRRLPDLTTIYGGVSAVMFNFEYPAPTDGWKNERGLLIDHVSHEVDLMRFVLSFEDGHPFSFQKVSDTAARYEVTGHAEENVSIHFSGDRTEKIPSWNRSRETLRIIFERGEAFVTSRKPGVFHRAIGETHFDRVHVSTPGNHFEYYRSVVENFALAIRREAPPYVSGKEMFVNAAAGVKLTLGIDFHEHFAILPSEDY